MLYHSNDGPSDLTYIGLLVISLHNPLSYISNTFIQRIALTDSRVHFTSSAFSIFTMLSIPSSSQLLSLLRPAYGVVVVFVLLLVKYAFFTNRRPPGTKPLPGPWGE
jgi:hypothetical protein